MMFQMVANGVWSNGQPLPPTRDSSPRIHKWVIVQQIGNCSMFRQISDPTKKHVKAEIRNNPEQIQQWHT